MSLLPYRSVTKRMTRPAAVQFFCFVFCFGTFQTRLPTVRFRFFSFSFRFFGFFLSFTELRSRIFFNRFLPLAPVLGANDAETRGTELKKRRPKGKRVWEREREREKGRAAYRTDEIPWLSLSLSLSLFRTRAPFPVPLKGNRPDVNWVNAARNPVTPNLTDSFQRKKDSR